MSNKLERAFALGFGVVIGIVGVLVSSIAIMALEEPSEPTSDPARTLRIPRGDVPFG